VVEDDKKGEVFTQKNVRSIRSGFGMHPKHYDLVLKSISTKDIERGTALTVEILKQ
jgi:pseudaminic acid synthase